MTDKIKQFIENHVDLIEECDFDTLYDQLSRYYYTLEEIDQVTKSLHSVEIYPEAYLTKLPTNYIDTKDLDKYLDQHTEILNLLLGRSQEKHRAVTIAKAYKLKIDTQSKYNRENPIPFIYNKSTSDSYQYVKDYITEVIVDDAVVNIPNGRFADSYLLKKITFGKKCTMIGPSAFENCNSLEEIILPDYVKLIGESAFANCKKLRKIKFSANQEEIPILACAGCIALEEVIIPEGIILIDSKAFRDCKNLKYIKFPDSLDRIGEFAFRGAGLENINLNKITVINKNAFENNINLNTISFGERCTGIDTRAFAGCTSLNNVTLPKNLHYAGNALFADCNKTLVVKYFIPASDANWARLWNSGYKIQRIE